MRIVFVATATPFTADKSLERSSLESCFLLHLVLSWKGRGEARGKKRDRVSQPFSKYESCTCAQLIATERLREEEISSSSSNFPRGKKGSGRRKREREKDKSFWKRSGGAKKGQEGKKKTKRAKKRPRKGQRTVILFLGENGRIFGEEKDPWAYILTARPGKPKKDQEGQKKAKEGQKRPRKCIFS